MSDQEIFAAIESVALENKLPCKAATAIANQFEVSPSRVGKICNEHKIQIVDCQLGCFGTKDKTSWS